MFLNRRFQKIWIGELSFEGKYRLPVGNALLPCFFNKESARVRACRNGAI